MPVKRTKKAPKDRNAPKKPLTAYFIFSGELRPSLREENKELKLTEIAKLLSTKWAALTVEEKAAYSVKAKADRERYNKEFDLYKQTENYKSYQTILNNWKQENKNTINYKNNKSTKNKKNKPKKPKQPENYPKKPLTAYFLYQNKRRKEIKAENSNAKNTEVAKQVGSEWKTLDSSDKKPYEEQSKLNKQKYENDMKLYKQTDEYKQYMNQLSKWKSDVKTWESMDDIKEQISGTPIKKIKLKLPKKPKDLNAPKKPISAYLMYSNQQREKLVKECKEKGEKPVMKTIQAQIGKMWQSLNDDDRKIYQDKINKEKQDYNGKFELYKKSENYQKHLKELDDWKKKCDELRNQHKNKVNKNSGNSGRKRRMDQDSSSDDSSSDDSSSDDSSSSADSSSSDDDSSSE